MSHDLSLAQAHAFRDLIPATVFEVDGYYGVLPSDEIDAGDDLEVIHEFYPFAAHEAASSVVLAVPATAWEPAAAREASP
ncbi:hypothetical protein B9J07_27425 [Sinorhizobium sp. LM21]|nr:hypothetical protein B9J07_27425 [Sinorhizobium sp. LM21]